MSFALRGVRMLSARGLRMTQARGYADEMAFTLASANKVFYESANVRQVDVPSFSGAFGILPKHVPTLGENHLASRHWIVFKTSLFLAVLKPGVVTVYETDGSTKKIFVSSGTITVNEDSSVQVLAEEAHSTDAIDASLVREILQQAQSQSNSATTEVVSCQICFKVDPIV